MKKHGKKMAAPIIIAVVVVFYYLGIVALFLWMEGVPFWAKVLITVVLLALSGVMLGVLVSRIKEIRSGEEDDLSKY